MILVCSKKNIWLEPKAGSEILNDCRVSIACLCVKGLICRVSFGETLGVRPSSLGFNA